jgi:hypothetical protein
MQPFSDKCRGVTSRMKVTIVNYHKKPQLEFLKMVGVASLLLCFPSRNTKNAIGKETKQFFLKFVTRKTVRFRSKCCIKRQMADAHVLHTRTKQTTASRNRTFTNHNKQMLMVALVHEQ